MPKTNKEAAEELLELRRQLGVRANVVARRLGVTEAWLSRRLNCVVEMRVNDYVRIREAIEYAAEKQSVLN